MPFFQDLEKRLHGAFAEFERSASHAERALVVSLLQRVHDQAHGVAADIDKAAIDKAAIDKAAIDHPELAYVYSTLFDLPRPPAPEAGKVVVTPSGELIGTGKWENMDPGWIEAGIEWLLHLFDRAPFVAEPQCITMPARTSLAIVGDWGTGNWEEDAPSTRVARAVAARDPAYTVHLGDVYYAGTSAAEHERLVALWPGKPGHSITLNSNHEMYAGAKGLFGVALTSELFSAQKGCSYVALENDHWILACLDTAYFADKWTMYLDGSLNDGQIAFLRSLKERAGSRRIIVLSHHQGLSLTGQPQEPLWSQVTGALGSSLAYWYWGHIHAAASYAPYQGVRGRCTGHGAVPYGDARELAGNAAVEWYETQSADDPRVPVRVCNGFVSIELDGPHITESFIDERNQVRWTSSTTSA